MDPGTLTVLLKASDKVKPNERPVRGAVRCQKNRRVTPCWYTQHLAAVQKLLRSIITAPRQSGATVGKSTADPEHKQHATPNSFPCLRVLL